MIGSTNFNPDTSSLALMSQNIKQIIVLTSNSLSGSLNYISMKYLSECCRTACVCLQ